MSKPIDNGFGMKFVPQKYGMSINPEDQCDICGDPLYGPVGGVLNEDGTCHLSCEEENDQEIMCCPICFENSDFCQGHGESELRDIGDCKICGEALDISRQGSDGPDAVLVVCTGHSLAEVKEYEKGLENAET